MNAITTRRTITAFAGTAAAIAITFGTAACGTDTGRDAAPAAPAGIGNAAPFHTSADAIDREKRNTKFHTSPDGTEHQQDEWRGYGYPSYAY